MAMMMTMVVMTTMMMVVMTTMMMMVVVVANAFSSTGAVSHPMLMSFVRVTVNTVLFVMWSRGHFFDRF